MSVPRAMMEPSPDGKRQRGIRAVTHDVVIRGGTIIDGTGAVGFAGDVGIDDGRISAVGGSLNGERTLSLIHI